MKEYEAACPVCGTVNKRLYLEETDGLMECEHCSCIVKVYLSANNKYGFVLKEKRIRTKV